MRVVAYFALRNERPYLVNFLEHLIENGVDYVAVDNGSTDGSVELLKEPRYARHLLALENLPYTGVFDWGTLLNKLETTVAGVDADWTILMAPDEIHHSFRAGETLAEAVGRIDGEGWNVIDFNEFVFLPVDNDYLPDSPKPQPLRHYYFFEPSRPRQMRARHRSVQASSLNSGGHKLEGQGIKLSPETFALRHYIFQSQAHAVSKYPDRQFGKDDLARGWHRNRLARPADSYIFPDSSELNCLSDPASRDFARDRPRKLHYWQEKWTD